MIGLRITRRAMPLIYPLYSPDDFWTYIIIYVVIVATLAILMLLSLIWIGYFKE